MAPVKRKLTNKSKGDIEETLDKLQDSHCSVPMGMIFDLTLKIETFLHKELTDGLKQSYLTDFFQVVN